MYTGEHVRTRPDQAAFIMAGTGEAVTYAELDARSNRLAHFLRSVGLNRLDHYAIFMENNARYLECCGAGERSGLYYTCINSFLTADEVAYIVNNSESQVLIFSEEKRAIATEVLGQCPWVKVALVAEPTRISLTAIGSSQWTVRRRRPTASGHCAPPSEPWSGGPSRSPSC